MALAPVPGLRGAGASADGHALPPGQLIVVAGQFCRPGNTIAAVQQPAHVMKGLAQIRQATGTERTFIFRIGASMPVMRLS